MENSLTLFYKAKCPGKIIITGEHAVVYGVSAISCAIDLFTEVEMVGTMNENDKYLIRIESNFCSFEIDDLKTEIFGNFLEISNFFTNFENINDINNIKINDLLQIASNDILNKSHFIIIFNVLVLFYEKNYQNFIKFLNKFKFTIKLTSDIPAGAGLGSSAAYNSCIVSCLFVKLY